MKLYFKKQLIVILILSWIIGCSSKQEYGSRQTQRKLCFGDTCFYVELADTPAQHRQGLMFRKNLPKDKGMLFLFEKEEYYSFWMKDTLIPLDIIWINKDEEVTFIKKYAQPCKQDFCLSIRPDKEAMYVLELNAGVCDSIGLKVGDKATFYLK